MLYMGRLRTTLAASKLLATRSIDTNLDVFPQDILFLEAVVA